MCDPTKALCDFCGDAAVAWIYPCVPFTTNFRGSSPDRQASGSIEHTGNDWGSCNACSALIEEDRREELAQRGARGTDPVVLSPMRVMFEQFHAHRRGARRPTVGRWS